MLELAKAKDAELGPLQVAELPHGSYEKRVSEALPPLPEAVQRLNDVVLPLNKQFEAVKPVSSFSEFDKKSELYERIPKKAKELIERLILAGATSSPNKAVAVTEVLVKWCWHIKKTAEMQFELEQEDYKKKCRMEAEPDAEEQRNKRRRTEEQLIQGYCFQHFPAIDELHARYHALLNERAAEKTKAEGEPRAQGPTETDA